MASGDPYQSLFEEIDELERRHPGRALEMALRVRDLIVHLDAESLGERWGELQIQSWAVLGSAYRLTFNFERAEEAFTAALDFFQDAELSTRLDPRIRPRLCQRVAYLRSDQGRFGEALELLEEALEIYADLGSEPHGSIALIDRAVIARRAGETHRPFHDLDQALQRLDPLEHPRGYLAAAHNLAVFLLEEAETPEELRETYSWMQVVAELHDLFPRGLDVLKFRTLLGLAMARAGRIDEGIAELQKAQEDFGAIEAHYDQAIVLLYLAGIYLELGRGDRVRRIAGQLFPLLGNLSADRRVTATLMLFYNAAQSGSVTRQLVAQVVAEVERLSREPPHLD